MALQVRTVAATVAQYLIPVLILGAGGAVFRFSGGGEKAAVPPPEPKPLRVLTAPVRLHDQGYRVDANGVVVPYREIRLAAEVSGRVVAKAPELDRGRFVTKGTVLLEIDPRDYQLEVARLKRELERAVVDLEQLEIEVANTQELISLAADEEALRSKSLSRLQGLAPKNIVSESALETSQISELAAKSATTRLKNQVAVYAQQRRRLEHAQELARLRLERAQLDLQRTTVVAPVDGIVVDELIELDEFVNRGTPLAALEDVSRVEVLCTLTASQFHQLMDYERGGNPESRSAARVAPPAPAADSAAGDSAPADSAPADSAPGDSVAGDSAAGDSAEVHAANRGERRGAVSAAYALPPIPATISYRVGEQVYQWKGVLSRYNGAGMDAATRTVSCLVSVPAPRRPSASPGNSSLRGPEALMRGMFVSVSMRCGGPVTMLAVPANALQPSGEVYVVRQGKLQTLDVEVTEYQDDMVLVVGQPQGGIQEGDQVVVSPLATAVDGQEVMMVEERS